MSHKQVGQPPLPLQVLQQVDNLGLDGHVQGGHRLIAHHHLGVKDQRPCKANPLPLSPGKLVGIAIEVLRPQSHLLHDVQSLGHALVSVAHVVDGQHLHQHIPHPLPGVQGSVGVLKNHLHIPAERQHLLAVQVGNVLPEEGDLAPCRLQQADQGSAQGAFAAAAFPYQAVGFSCPQGQADPVHCLHFFGFAPQSPFHREIGAEVFCLKDHIALAHGSSSFPLQGHARKHRTLCPFPTC